ncbi:MAG TPA: hypothetical protein VLA61_19665 [Ideonella sp.]|uniref:hypothetical protein n=1 Tax=Ideonella sp. TaxID=1929293 RepID=UPI002C40C781|nr:hypothetical protein [Ideonella sp.]HSI50490.1 hypothetical protein [Ideonella sp.]
MPSLRLATWNSGGEAAGRGAQLAAAVNMTNGTPPAVELVAIQEAKVALVPQGTIRAQLTSGAAPFATFAVPPDHVRELGPGQPFAVGVNRAYLVAWDAAGPGALAPAAAAARISLAPVAMPAANGVETYIAALPISGGQKNNLRQAARNIRAPVRKQFTLTAGMPPVAHTVYFYTWHADLQANWLNATWATVGLVANPFTGPGMYPAFEFFQNSDQFQADLAATGPNDVIVIAGDFNITGADLNNNPALFPNFAGASHNLSHVLAYSPSMALGLAQTWNVVTPYPPHCIITVEVQW